MSAPAICVRPATRADVPQLWRLMRALAAFEKYLDDFALTESELLRRGFPADGLAEFSAWVAVAPDAELVGYVVYYEIPFTYDLKPTLVIKELFVALPHRGRGIGRALLDATLCVARERGCGLIKWAVLPGNQSAQSLYRSWGGAPDQRWDYWCRSA